MILLEAHLCSKWYLFRFKSDLIHSKFNKTHYVQLCIEINWIIGTNVTVLRISREYFY